MKRFTHEIKNYDLLATLVDILFVVIYLILLMYFFVILVEPENITEIVNTNYNILFFTISSTTLNVWISLTIGALLVTVPNAFQHIKRALDKETIEMDEWNYRSQVIYGIIDTITLNWPGAVLRFKVAHMEMLIVSGYGLKQGFKGIVCDVVNFFRSIGTKISNKRADNKEFKENIRKLGIEKAKKIKHQKTIARKGTESQQDLERIGRNDLIWQVLRTVLTYTFLTIFALFIFIPFYWMILTALKTNEELTTAINPRFFIGLGEMQWVNFKIALTQFDFYKYLGNTIVVGILSMLGTVTTTILASFAFSRLQFKGREAIFSVLLMTMMIPGELYTITNYITVRNLGWYDSFSALIFPFMTSVFYIFFLRQSFKQIPDTLYRAAQVDGCGDVKYLTRVMIPIARPTIITITILSAIGAWDAYIWPQLVTPSKEHWLISVALRSTSFVTGVGSDARPVYNIQLAASALVTVPLLIIFFSLKKYIIRGVGRSGTKG